jgi:alkylation response protein AidB-like acyl-CoA dehydrogenase
MAYGFAQEKLEPKASEWDKTKEFPVDVYREAADLGFGGIYVSEEYGGCGLGRLEASLIFEALSTGCVGSSAYISIHNMVAWMIDSYGSIEQKERFLNRLTSMELLSSYCLTEPDSGSDAQAMKSFAEDKGDHFVLNGSKAFISGAGTPGQLYLVMCKTGPNEVSSLILEDGMEGLSYGANEQKMGWNVQPTRSLNFDDIVVPKENLLGKRGQGFKIALSGLDGGRLNIASCSIGGAAKSLEIATDYVK